MPFSSQTLRRSLPSSFFRPNNTTTPWTTTRRSSRWGNLHTRHSTPPRLHTPPVGNQTTRQHASCTTHIHIRHPPDRDDACRYYVSTYLSTHLPTTVHAVLQGRLSIIDHHQSISPSTTGGMRGTASSSSPPVVVLCVCHPPPPVRTILSS